MAPCDIFCINMSKGTTIAMPANESVPNFATNHDSMIPVLDCASIIRMFGHANLKTVGTMGPSSIA